MSTTAAAAVPTAAAAALSTCCCSSRLPHHQDTSPTHLNSSVPRQSRCLNTVWLTPEVSVRSR
jgi:hypothetical protein